MLDGKMIAWAEPFAEYLRDAGPLAAGAVNTCPGELVLADRERTTICTGGAVSGGDLVGMGQQIQRNTASLGSDDQGQVFVKLIINLSR
jgi:hypothetical protein